MKHFKIQENYLLLKKWWETFDLTNYEKSLLNREIISFNQQLLRLKEKKLRIGVYGISGVGKSSVLNSLLKKDIFKTDIINGTTKEIQSEICEPVEYIPEMIKADQLLTKFDKNHNGVKVVVDEFGGFVGIIGAEAVLSVLAGWWKNKS